MSPGWWSRRGQHLGTGPAVSLFQRALVGCRPASHPPWTSHKKGGLNSLFSPASSFPPGTAQCLEGSPLLEWVPLPRKGRTRWAGSSPRLLGCHTQDLLQCHPTWRPAKLGHTEAARNQEEGLRPPVSATTPGASAVPGGLLCSRPQQASPWRNQGQHSCLGPLRGPEGFIHFSPNKYPHWRTPAPPGPSCFVVSVLRTRARDSTWQPPRP